MNMYFACQGTGACMHEQKIFGIHFAMKNSDRKFSTQIQSFVYRIPFTYQNAKTF